jgi:hypothetical protein
MGSRLERVRPGSRGGVFLSAEEPGGAPPPRQVIHGDLNPGNRLVSPDEPVGIVDLAPYSGSADFALAMSANWIGPRRGRVSLLEHFADVPQFGYLLLRAAIRMLVVIVELDGDRAADIAFERGAARLVLNWLGWRSRPGRGND